MREERAFESWNNRIISIFTLKNTEDKTDVIFAIVGFFNIQT